MIYVGKNVELDNKKLSICCNQPVFSKTDICSKCKEHSEVKSHNDTSLTELNNRINYGFKPGELYCITAIQTPISRMMSCQ